MPYKIQTTRVLSSQELLSVLCESATLYSEYAGTTLLFIFREKKSDAYDYYEARFGKNNFMHLAGIKSETLNANEFYEACMKKNNYKKRLYSSQRLKHHVFQSGYSGTNAGSP